MKSGSSAINNIHTATVTEPNIRATLKYNSFIGSGTQGVLANKYFANLKTTVFNNNYVCFTNQLDQANNYIYTYNSGGSLVGTYGVSNTGAADNLLQRGDFVNTGNTLNLYFIHVWPTAGITTAWNTGVIRLSSINGISWYGATYVSVTEQLNNAYNVDIAMPNDTEMYLTGTGIIKYPGGVFDACNVIQYGLVGSTTKTMYTSMYDMNSINNCIDAFQVGDNRFLLFESGAETTILSKLESLAYFTLSSYPSIKLMRVGSTSIFEARDIATTGTSIEGLHLVCGEVGSSFVYFGIEKYIREVVPYLDASGIPEEYVPDIDTTYAICKMDSKGRIYERAVGLGGTFMASICASGTSSVQIQDLSIFVNDGSSHLLMYPFFETYGSSTDISDAIIEYNNNDNKRISLKLGNLK